nr:hypothetical protein [Mucilaginibacter sp. FT3.2]
MGQILRITFEKKDYTFELVNPLSVSKDSKCLDILLEHINYRMVKNNGSWVFENTDDDHLIRLSAAIGKSISLRYRI